MSKIKGKRAATLIILLLIAAGFWQWHRYATGQTLISDAKLTELFRRNQATFERLHQMAVEDNLKGRIGTNYVDDKDLATRRLEEYRQRMRDSGVQMLSFDRERGAIFFMIHSQGTVIAGRSKGIAYFIGPPKSRIADSLDKPCLTPEESVCGVVRHIEGDWWMLRQDSR